MESCFSMNSRSNECGKGSRANQLISGDRLLASRIIDFRRTLFRRGRHHIPCGDPVHNLLNHSGPLIALDGAGAVRYRLQYALSKRRTRALIITSPFQLTRSLTRDPCVPYMPFALVSWSLFPLHYPRVATW